MKKLFLIKLFLFLGVFLTPFFLYGNECVRSLSPFHSIYSSQSNAVSLERIEYFRNLIREGGPGQISQEDLREVEVKFALIEEATATAFETGVDWMGSNNLSNRTANRIIGRLRNTDFTRLTPESTLHLIENIYALANQATFLSRFRSWPFRNSEYRPFNRNYVRHRIETSLVSRNLYGSLEEMNILHGSKLTELKAKFDRNRILPLAFNTALNVFSLLKAGLPLWLPSISLSRAHVYPESVYQTLEEEGFEAAFQEVLRIYPNLSRFDVLWPRVARTYNLIVQANIALFLIQSSSFVLTYDPEAPIVVESLEYVEAIKEEQVQSWRLAIYEITGEYPSEEDTRSKRDELQLLTLEEMGLSLSNSP